MRSQIEHQTPIHMIFLSICKCKKTDLFIIANFVELMDNNQYVDKNIKLFHTLTFAEIVDNLSNSIIILFKQVYTLDISGFMKSQDNYIYYGITFIFIYIMFKMIYQELTN